MSGEEQKMRELTYLVVKNFKYNGKVYVKGDYWEPDGGQFDSQIIGNQDARGGSCVRTIDPNVETKRERMTGHKYAADIIRMKDKKKMTFRQIAAELNIHYSTASRIYKREKGARKK